MKRQLKERKKIIRALLLWLGFIAYINIIQPSSILSYLGFYILFSGSLYMTFKLFTNNFQSIIWIALLDTFLLLRQFHLDNILNTIILMGIFITFEIYFRRN